MKFREIRPSSFLSITYMEIHIPPPGGCLGKERHKRMDRHTRSDGND